MRRALSLALILVLTSCGGGDVDVDVGAVMTLDSKVFSVPIPSDAVEEDAKVYSTSLLTEIEPVVDWYLRYMDDDGWTWKTGDGTTNPEKAEKAGLGYNAIMQFCKTDSQNVRILVGDRPDGREGLAIGIAPNVSGVDC